MRHASRAGIWHGAPNSDLAAAARDKTGIGAL
jgi:hypothetical protein